MTKLNIWALSGLGNRVRALLGAKELADRNNWDFSYTWDARSAGLTAELGDLWEHTFNRESPFAVTVRRLPRRRFDSRDLREWPTGLENRRRIDLKTGGYITDRAGEHFDWGKQLRALTPAAEVARRIDLVSNEMGAGNFVGVMIRAHSESHPKSIEFSPVSWYEQRMRELLELHPHMRFYISCDVPEVADELVSKFPMAMTQHNKGAYNTTSGTQAAVADLYMLASASGLLRPFYSSFTTMASALSNHAILLEDSQSTVSLNELTLVARASDPFAPWERDLRTG